jgi:hypothetical protein
MKLKMSSWVGVGVALVVFGGCHAVFPLEPPWIDNPDSGISVPHVDTKWASLDSGITPDTLEPDLAPKPDQDLGPQPYYEDFEHNLGDVFTASTTCVLHGGQLAQQSESVLGICGTLYVPYADYRVETTVTVESLKPDPLMLLWQGAGIGVRVQDTGPPAEEKPGYYACIVSPDGGSLSVARCNPLTKACAEKKYKTASIKLKTPYKLRATVTGDSLSCEIPGVVGPVTYQIKDYTAGAVSLVTLAAVAAFDDLSVEPL